MFRTINAGVVTISFFLVLLVLCVVQVTLLILMWSRYEMPKVPRLHL
jgi:hypothetical protein